MDRLSGHEGASLENSSFGGDVADYFGRVQELMGGEKYYTMKPWPQQSSFESDDLETATGRLVSMHGNRDDIEILSGRVDDFFGVQKDQKLPENLPAQYTQVKSILKEALENLNNKPGAK